ncbi:hypothetical protein C499_13815 [Halogeometricum borinquense DSM 11551]|uniref:Uncharacterized protein n=1 Tax=Halogeometricum borinquense (strain ATCC 700274 / DSM 11551 / JCM 10706 / KCTC 4070 / PR3) TaxID=469382 RepID=E4NU43_HALBP|nr:hypothetical protein Hbor_30260 [Halogeometricum borinquense DSM 11551]ELY25566.1 hypothetical protein C499_13815 [Halogeometricum borinquense DSM 11551]
MGVETGDRETVRVAYVGFTKEYAPVSINGNATVD